MRSLIAAFAFYLCATLSAQTSQPPAPSRGVLQQQQQGDATAQRGNPNPSNETSPPSRLGDISVIQVQRIDPDQQSTNQRDEPLADWLPLTLNDLVVIVLTFAIGVIAYIQAVHMRVQNDHMRTIERAYIAAVVEPPGVQGVQGPEPYVIVKLQNTGRTPGTITHGLVRVHSQPKGSRLPTKPPYGADPRDGQGIQAFVHSEQHVNFMMPFEKIDPAVDQYLLISFVYVDQFERRHQFGYARIYSALRSEGNLSYVRDEGYNFDIPLDAPAKWKFWR